MDEEIVLNLQECPPKYDSMQVDELIDLLTKLQKKSSPRKSQKGSGIFSNDTEESIKADLLKMKKKARQSNSNKIKFIKRYNDLVNLQTGDKKNTRERFGDFLFEKNDTYAFMVDDYINNIFDKILRTLQAEEQKGGGEDYFEKQKEQLILKINSTKSESEKSKLIESLNRLSKQKYNSILEEENVSQLNFLRNLQKAIIKKINSIPQSPERSDFFEKNNQLSKDISNYLKLLQQQSESTSAFDKNVLQNQIELIMLKYKHGYRIANYLNSDINYIMNFLTSPNLSPVEEEFKKQLINPVSVKSESIKSPSKKFISTSPLRKEITNFKNKDFDDNSQED
jgi:hypothetical protein